MSESESDTDPAALRVAIKRDELAIRLASLQQENRVLKVELDTYKLKYNALLQENKELRQASVNIQARAEQEEEFISNTLMKKIQELKKEKENLVNKYETEEEFLTNELQRQLNQLRQEKVELEQTLEKEQEKQVNILMRKIEKLKKETHDKHYKLEELRREKIELENTLEKEQEGLVNRLWKKMDKLETEKRLLQEKLNQPVSAPPSPRQSVSYDGGTSENLTAHVRYLKKEVDFLRRQLKIMQNDRSCKVGMFMSEEKSLREENARLHRQLLLETERREALSRQLSESESSLEMDDETRQNMEGMPSSSTVLHSRSMPTSYNPPRSMSPHVTLPTVFVTPNVHITSPSGTGVHVPASALNSAAAAQYPASSRHYNTTTTSATQEGAGFVKPSSPT